MLTVDYEVAFFKGQWVNSVAPFASQRPTLATLSSCRLSSKEIVLSDYGQAMLLPGESGAQRSCSDLDLSWLHIFNGFHHSGGMALLQKELCQTTCRSGAMGGHHDRPSVLYPVTNVFHQRCHVTGKLCRCDKTTSQSRGINGAVVVESRKLPPALVLF